MPFSPNLLSLIVQYNTLSLPESVRQIFFPIHRTNSTPWTVAATDNPPAVRSDVIYCVAGPGPHTHTDIIKGGCAAAGPIKNTHPLHISIICPVMLANAVADHFTQIPGRKKSFFCRVSYRNLETGVQGEGC